MGKNRMEQARVGWNRLKQAVPYHFLPFLPIFFAVYSHFLPFLSISSHIFPLVRFFPVSSQFSLFFPGHFFPNYYRFFLYLLIFLCYFPFLSVSSYIFMYLPVSFCFFPLLPVFPHVFLFIPVSSCFFPFLLFSSSFFFLSNFVDVSALFSRLILFLYTSTSFFPFPPVFPPVSSCFSRFTLVFFFSFSLQFDWSLSMI